MQRLPSDNLTTFPNSITTTMLNSSRAGHHGYNVAQDVMYLVITPAFCVLGILGNITNITVLLKGRLRMRRVDGEMNPGTHWGLVLLSASDIGFCAALFPRAFFDLNGSVALFPRLGWRIYYQAYGTGLVTMLISTSTWVTVAMTVLRYLGICHPLPSRRIKMTICAGALYGSAIVVSILVNVPSFWQYEISPLVIAPRTFYLIDLGHFAMNTTRGAVFLWCRTVYGIIAPFCILCFCNVSLWQTLRESRRMRQQFHVAKTAGHYSRRTTRMLVAIVLFFLLFVLPTEALDFFNDVIKMDYHKPEVFMLIRGIFNLLQVINFSCNFLLYCTVNSHFRSIARSLVCCWRVPDPFHDLSPRYRESMDYRHMSFSSNSRISNGNLVVKLRSQRGKRESVASHTTCVLSMVDFK